MFGIVAVRENTKKFNSELNVKSQPMIYQLHSTSNPKAFQIKLHYYRKSENTRTIIIKINKTDLVDSQMDTPLLVTSRYVTLFFINILSFASTG